MAQKVVLLMNTKGGPGKTMAAMSVATWWGGPLTIVDVDARKSLSITNWLDKAEQGEGVPDDLVWIKAAADDLSSALQQMQGTVLVDSAGQVPTSEMLSLAQLADLVVIPGASNELEAIGETVSTLRDGLKETPPIGVVLTKANPVAMKGRIAPATALIESSLHVKVLGWLPFYADIADAPQNGQMLDQIGERARSRLKVQTVEIVKGIKRMINA